MGHKNSSLQNRAEFGKHLQLRILLSIWDNKPRILSCRIFLPVSHD